MSWNLERKARNRKRFMEQEERRRKRLLQENDNATSFSITSSTRRDILETSQRSPSKTESIVQSNKQRRDVGDKSSPRMRSGSPSCKSSSPSPGWKRPHMHSSKTPIDPKWLDNGPNKKRPRQNSLASPRTISFSQEKQGTTKKSISAANQPEPDDFEAVFNEFKYDMQRKKGSIEDQQIEKPKNKSKRDGKDSQLESERRLLESEASSKGTTKVKTLRSLDRNGKKSQSLSDDTQSRRHQKPAAPVHGGDEDSPDDEIWSIANALGENPPKVPKNPLRLSRENDSIEQEDVLKAKTAPGDDSLWSDSDPDDSSQSEEVEKKGRKSRAQKSKKLPEHEQSASYTFDGIGVLEEILSNNPIVKSHSSLLKEGNEKELRELLHPILQQPKFGPFALEPLDLQNETAHHQVPASLARYLAPFQREGVSFLHECLTSHRGGILGDDMGCGKTVQVLSLLSGLLRKTGTGIDVQHIDRRQRAVKSFVIKEQQAQELALKRGELLPSRPNMTFEGLKDLDSFPSDWWPILIVVPPTLIENWKNEFAMFTNISAVYYTGKNRASALTRLVHGMAEVLVTTKALFQQKRDFAELNSIPIQWKLVVIDEFHTWKSKLSLAAQNLRKLKVQHNNLVLGMTGTLMSNNHMELWNLIDLTESNYLGNWDEFRDKIADHIKLGRAKTASTSLIEKSNSKAKFLREKLKKILIERSKEEVLKDFLPQKNEKLVLCELSPLQKIVYQHILTLPDIDMVRKSQSACDCGVNRAFFQRLQGLKTPADRVAYYRQNKKEIKSRGKCCYRTPMIMEGEVPTVIPDAAIWRMLDAHKDGTQCKSCPYCCGLPGLTKLYKLGDHLALLQTAKTHGSNVVGSPAYIDYMKNLEFSKVAFPPEVLERMPGKGLIRHDGIMDNHLELSGKLKVLDRLLLAFSEEGARVLLFSYSTQTLDLIQNYLRAQGHSFLRMDGKTNPNQRQDLANKFNRDPTIFVFLLSTKAMGTGLNLTSANKVIIFDVEWNPSNDEQAQDRAYRIGQEKDVEVLRLVSQGTIDELKYLRQLYKVQLKQETMVDTEKGAENAPRVFRGVQGDKYRKGELFGYENLFRFKDGCFLHDIWKQTGKKRTASTNTGLEMHEASRLTEALLGIGSDRVDAVLEDESSRLETLLASVSQSTSKCGVKDRETEPMSVEDEAHQAPSIPAQAFDHQDLFRGDRGRATIQEGEDGFDEEMGGGTQNIYELYEQRAAMPNDRELSEDPLHSTGSDGALPRYEGSPVATRIETELPASFALGGQEPEWAVRMNRQSEATAENDRSHMCIELADSVKRSKLEKKTKEEAKVSRCHPGVNVNLFGMASRSIGEHQHTTFSSKDILLPSYSKKKRRKRKTKSRVV